MVTNQNLWKTSEIIKICVRMEKASWVCTFVVQVSLCIAFYLALNLGQPQKSIFQSRNDNGKPLDVYFLSVRGGYRPRKQQALLLKQMEKVANIYKARFVISISELGEDDPLTQNARRLFPPLKVPWYTTRTSRRGGVGCFLEQINITHRKALTVIGVDTGLIQDIMLQGSMNGFRNSQLNWLTETLEATASDWIIVAGYHPGVICEEEQLEAKQVYGPLHHIFTKYGVNAYLSSQGCTNPTPDNGVSYLGIPNPVESEHYLVSLNRRSAFQKEMVNDGFLLHRLSLLEITTYFVTSAGEVVNETITRQRGKEVM